MREAVGLLTVAGLVLATTIAGHAQSVPARPWELTVDGRVGVPSGSVQVGEKPVAGTRLRLRSDLGIDVSEAVEASVAYSLTPRDAVRASFLQYFLDGSAAVTRPFSYNGPVYDPGPVHSRLDFSRLSLAYERALLASTNGATVTGTAGMTYVSLDAVVHGNHEDFYRQELPVPILGLRLTYPIQRLSIMADLSGGGLPRVDSLRREGGTVYLQQRHADAAIGAAYALTSALAVTTGYHLTYFSQREKSHEDDNRFVLIDNGFHVGLALRF